MTGRQLAGHAREANCLLSTALCFWAVNCILRAGALSIHCSRLASPRFLPQLFGQMWVGSSENYFIMPFGYLWQHRNITPHWPLHATLIIIILRVSRERSGFPSGRSAALERASHFPACLFTRLCICVGGCSTSPLTHTQGNGFMRAHLQINLMPKTRVITVKLVSAGFANWAF